MTAILFVKTSSLGDVVHHMPAVSEARKRHPHGRISWLVEQEYAPLVRLHPGVDDVIEVAARRWRGSALQPMAWRAMRAFVADLRRRSYDVVIDAQGLVRSALIARMSRGVRHGYDAASVREPFAAYLYDVRHTVDRQWHAIARNRELTAHALGYRTEDHFDYGLGKVHSADAAGARYAVLLHGSARAAKEWPVDRWITVAEAVRAEGLEVRLPWGNAAEKARSEVIARALGSSAHVPSRLPLDQVACSLAGATLVIGVDTGLMHLAAALRAPLIAIFTSSDPTLTGPRGSGPITVLGGFGQVPSVNTVLSAVAEALSQTQVSMDPTPGRS
jgi:lipopolysaccharide heptosyltransferase I